MEEKDPSATQRILNALKTARLKIEQLEQKHNEAIAIVGLGVRLPNQIDTPEKYWQLLEQGIDAVSNVPAERWDSEAYYDADTAIGHINNKQGAFLQSVDTFDPQFFNISPREAANLDPQQRLVLETAWEALEREGLIPERLDGINAGVFIGITANDYAQLSHDETRLNAYYNSGNSLNVAAGRISYTLGLTGPSMAVDTACSSSLTAVHLACQSLRHRECNLAVAGGVNLMLLVENTIALSQAQMLSPDGRCKTFDASANGYGRGEGCGIIVLKRLSDALKDGDNIRAVIRGSAINQDGASGGLTVPSGVSQQQVIQQAQQNAKVSPEQIDYIEAHGTGTPLGDPIEINALASVFQNSHTPDKPLYVGSVKTNIGHLESAAGIAGLIKLVLALEHQVLPRQLHYSTPNPRIDWANSPVQVVSQNQAWPRSEQHRRIAGISAFGFSGTNAHLILEEAPQATGPAETISDTHTQILALSAKTDAALNTLITQYQAYLKAPSTATLNNLCYTANTGRQHFSHRHSIVFNTRDDLLSQLSEQSPTRSSQDRDDTHNKPGITYLFSGQGSQYTGMGHSLYQNPGMAVFKATLEQCADGLKNSLDIPLLDLLFNEQHSDALNQTAYTQVALYSLEVALARQWQALGIHASCVLGHSVGEYAAAHIAGVFSLEDGLKLISARGKLMQALPQNGSMLIVFQDLAQVTQTLQHYQQHNPNAQISLAAQNAPQCQVLSGEHQALQALAIHFKEQGTHTQTLNVSHAFHSPLMQPILDDFKAAAQSIQYQTPKIPLISNLTGQLADSSIAHADYWVQHILACVQFQSSLETAQQQNPDSTAHYLEIGPKNTLIALAKQILEHENTHQTNTATAHYHSSLNAAKGDRQTLETLATLYQQGLKINWKPLYGFPHKQKISLPTYPFQRQRYWLETTAKNSTYRREQTTSTPAITAIVIQQPLLGHKLPSALQHLSQYQATLNSDSPAWLKDHRIHHQILYPATAYIEHALEAVIEQTGSTAVQLQALDIQRPLAIAQDTLIQTHLAADPQQTGQYQCTLYSCPVDSLQDNQWTQHAQAQLTLAEHSSSETVTNTHNGKIDLSNSAFTNTQTLDPNAYYQSLAELGLHYGASFQNIRQITQYTKPTKQTHTQTSTDQSNTQSSESAAEGVTSNTIITGLIELSPEQQAEAQHYQLHPCLLDSCLQLIKAALPDNPQSYVPVALKALHSQKAAGARIHCQIQLHTPTHAEQNYQRADLYLSDDQGRDIAQLLELTLQTITADQLHSNDQSLVDCYHIAWHKQTLETAITETPQESPNYLLFIDDSPLADTLSTALKHSTQVRIGATGSHYQKQVPSQVPKETDNETHQHTDNKTETLIISIDPANPQHYEALLQDLQIAHKPVQQILHVWSLSINALADTALANESNDAQHIQQTEHTLQQAHQLGSESVLHLLHALEKNRNCSDKPITPQLTLVTQNAQAIDDLPISSQALTAQSINPLQAPLLGLAKVIVLEKPELNCRRIDLDQSASPAEQSQQLCQELHATDNTTHKQNHSQGNPDQTLNEDQIVYRQGQRYVPRLKKKTLNPPKPNINRPLRLKDYGIEQLQRIECANTLPAADEIQIAVTASGLNFRDVLHALGMLKDHSSVLNIKQAQDIPFGFECAGTITQLGQQAHNINPDLKIGDRVMAVLTEGSMADTINVNAHYVVHTPSKLNDRAAASLPLAFLTAQYGLEQLGQLQANESILIHAAAGGVGQAALQIAQHYQLDIHATAHPDKWDTLKRQGITQLYHSRHANYAQAILDKTQGKGVSIVLNSLTDDFIPENLKCLAQGGRYIEIGKIGIWTAQQMQQSRPDVHYYPFDLGEVGQQQPYLILQSLQQLKTRIETGILKALPYQSYPLNQAQTAFQHMAKAQHIGKIILTQNSQQIKARHSYLITGGLGGLGLKLAQWLLENGAQHLTLNSYSAPSQDTRHQLETLKTEHPNANISLSLGDISDAQYVKSLLQTFKNDKTQEGKSSPNKPLAGIIHTAGKLDDSILDQLHIQQYRDVAKVKINGSWYLHHYSQRYAPALDFFINYASASALLGAPGQGNYAAANAYLDSLSHYRQKMSLPGLSVDWGPWAEVGMLKTLQAQDQQRVMKLGWRQIKPTQGLNTLQAVLADDEAQMGVLDLIWENYFAQFIKSQPPAFLETVQPKEAGGDQKTLLEESFLQQLEAKQLSERLLFIEQYLLNKVQSIIGSNAAIHKRDRLFDLGMDSLMAVELKNRLEFDMQKSLVSTLLFDYPSLEDLSDYVRESILVEFFAVASDVEIESDAEDDIAALLAKELEDLG